MIVYKITNKLDGKIYVGQTKKSMEERWRGHLRCVIKKLNRPLYNAIAKYGQENFVIETLVICQTVKELTPAEKHWILELESFKPDKGYNLTLGGENLWNMTPEQRKLIIEKLSIATKNQWANRSSEERKLINQKISESSLDERGPISQKTREKISNISLNNWSDPEKKEKFLLKRRASISNWTEEEIDAFKKLRKQVANTMHQKETLEMKQQRSRNHVDTVFTRKYLKNLDRTDQAFEFVEIDTIELCAEKEDVFDITVQDNHNFFADDLLVHNCIGGPLAYAIFHEFKNLPQDQLGPHLLDDEIQMNRAVQAVANVYDQITDAVGRENFFPEIQFNKLTAQHTVNRAILEFSKRYNIKIVATCDSHYCRPEFWKAREMYKKLGWLGYANITPESLPKNIEDLKCELYPKNAEQMWDAYKKYGSEFSFYAEHDQRVKEAIEISWNIVHDMIGDVSPDCSDKLPSYVVPKGQTPMFALKEAIQAGLERKGLSDKPAYIERVKYELEVIESKSFELYFITMKAIFDVATEIQLTGPARGSAGGSLVNYLLGITQIDPIKFDLNFERFLARSRTEAPDIDSDLADRDQLIVELRTRFGEENIIPISNINTLQLKSLTKDISKFYDIPFEEVSAGTVSVERDVRNKIMGAADDKNLFVLTYDDAMKYSDSYREFINAHPEVAENIQILYKQPRSIGRHAGGVLISENIQNRMPVISVRGESQTPWVEGVTHKNLGAMGWLKFDLLGLETLRIIQTCIERILQRHHNISKPTFQQIDAWFHDNLHPDKINLNDPKVYETVYQPGRFAATFQFTQHGAQKFIQKFKPKNLMDIAIATSIYRPGPLGAKVDDIYLKNRDNMEEAEKNEHPLVWKVLKDTCGAIIFQEQLMSLAHHVAGFPIEETERVRKTILKQSIATKEANKANREGGLRTDFINGCVKNGLTEKDSANLWDKILFFCGYGFNKCCTGDTEVLVKSKNTDQFEPKMMKNIQSGDIVLTRNEQNQTVIPTKVVKRHYNGKQQIVQVTLKSGAKIKCTMNHKFRVQETGQMMPLSEIIQQKLSIVEIDPVSLANYVNDM